MRNRAAGIAWYRQEDYAKIRKIMADPRNFPETYKQWLKGAKKASDKLIAEGYTVEKAYIDPATFPGWCNIRSLDVNGKARIRFANEFVFKKHATKAEVVIANKTTLYFAQTACGIRQRLPSPNS